MSRKVIDLTGKRFGRLVAIKRAGTDKSRYMLWLCVCDCGVKKAIRGSSLRNDHTKSCGCLQKEVARQRAIEMAGNKSPSWKGGRLKHSGGYTKVMHKGHSRADNKGYVLEHVLVWEEANGHSLPKGATLHHINGIRNDNRIENLEVWTGKHPMGVRIKDMMDFCTNFQRKHQAPPAFVGGAGI